MCREANGRPPDSRAESRLVGLQEPRSLEAERVEDFVIPENVAPRMASFRQNRFGQPDRLGGFHVEFRLHGNPGIIGKIVKDRPGELRIQRRVRNH